LVVWLGFGVAAHLLYAALHAMAQRSVWLTFNAWVLGAGVLAIAGLFQFSRLKYHCLDQCRTPLSFIIQHWHGVTSRLDAMPSCSVCVTVCSWSARSYRSNARRSPSMCKVGEVSHNAVLS
jgi:predicted metal-binding membrane protein